MKEVQPFRRASSASNVRKGVLPQQSTAWLWTYLPHHVPSLQDLRQAETLQQTRDLALTWVEQWDGTINGKQLKGLIYLMDTLTCHHEPESLLKKVRAGFAALGITDKHQTDNYSAFTFSQKAGAANEEQAQSSRHISFNVD